jgi:hypothetical protein
VSTAINVLARRMFLDGWKDLQEGIRSFRAATYWNVLRIWSRLIRTFVITEEGAEIKFNLT